MGSNLKGHLENYQPREQPWIRVSASENAHDLRASVGLCREGLFIAAPVFSRKT